MVMNEFMKKPEPKKAQAKNPPTRTTEPGTQPRIGRKARQKIKKPIVSASAGVPPGAIETRAKPRAEY